MNMKLPILIFILYSLCINLSNTREITHEDIKDAMLSLVHMMRENTEKLERHDLRERLSGEQLKKTMTMLTKRVSAVDGLKAQLMKLESRITGIEQLISQSDERERIQMQKTTDTLEDLENRLEGWFTDLETKIAEVNNRPDTTSDDNIITDVLTKLNNTESLVKGQLPELQHVLKNEAMKLRNEAAAQTEKAKELFIEVRDLTNKVDYIKTSLDNIEEKSKQFLEKQQEPQLDVIPIMDKQERVLDRIHKLLEGTSDKIRDLPRVNEIQTFHNETQTLLQEAKHALKDIVTQKVDDIENKIMETKEETKDVVEALRMDLANNAERVNQELHDLNKGQSVMVSMADHVLDTKKRVEYGVHQILLEVGDLVKSQGININNTLNQRFDGISNDIMDNQNGALANLTIKMEHEMNQVWRQINVMYQQMMESAKALDKLHKQNEAYVNGTTSTMDGMESTVSEITKRMSEVDNNLNFLLGRLSLVTQEFNQIKTGLGAALDNIKASFKEVQEKANDLRHPGPHPVPENYKEINESETKKPDGKPLPELEQKMINYIFNPPSN